MVFVIILAMAWIAFPMLGAFIADRKNRAMAEGLILGASSAPSVVSWKHFCPRCRRTSGGRENSASPVAC